MNTKNNIGQKERENNGTPKLSLNRSKVNSQTKGENKGILVSDYKGILVSD